MKQFFFISFACVSLMLSQPIPGTAADSVVVDTFSSCVKSGIPCGWRKLKSINGLTLNRDSGNYYVRLKSNQDIQMIGTKVSIIANEFPYLQWRWRVHVLPSSGKEDIKDQSNSAAGVYVLFKGGFPIGRSIKYVWSNSLPPGARVISPFSSKSVIFVLRSGEEGLGKWQSEERSVFDDYRKAFGSEPNPINGIAIMTSSDRTHSKASADYDDFVMLRKQVAEQDTTNPWAVPVDQE